ncbi:hypothetical protein BH09MYX1_BH09MYX1_04600 [soil metagenome]
MRLTWLALAFATLLPLAVACGPRDRTRYDNNPQPTATTPTVVGPVTVVIDTNQTMTAAGGDGVGVFVEYKSGGHWALWWTCDTSRSNLGCAFTINGSALGKLKNLTGDADAHLDAGALVIGSSVTTEAHEIAFDTNPGDDLTLDARVTGITPSTSLFFFVQDGKINGGYTGALTNPLIFQPSQP